MFARLRNKVSSVSTIALLCVARFVPGGWLPGDRLGWIYTPRRMAKLQSRIFAILDELKEGKALEQCLCGFNGKKFGERVVEYPYLNQWLRSKGDCTRLLDVGCVLNNPCAEEVVKERCKSVWFCNPSLEPIAWEGPEIYYAVSILDQAFRKEKFRFSHITCLSTLEHIGYDNSQYGVRTYNPLIDPCDETLISSLRRLCEFLEIGGNLLVSVPFGSRGVGRHRVTKKIAFQVFDAAVIDQALNRLSCEFTGAYYVFAATKTGWHQLESPEEFQEPYGHGCPGAAAVAILEIMRKGLQNASESPSKN